jgi:hypothetical protein
LHSLAQPPRWRSSSACFLTASTASCAATTAASEVSTRCVQRLEGVRLRDLLGRTNDFGRYP